MAKIFYVRCSTEEQNPARQFEMAEKLECEKTFVDMLSGKNTERPELQKMLDYVREGDTVYVESFSRLARSVKDLLSIVEVLKEKNVGFHSLKEQIDTSTPQGKFMLTVFGALADLEREQILQRQKEGIEIAKREGKYKGRQPKYTDPRLFEMLYEKILTGETTKTWAARQLGISRAALDRRIKWHEEDLKNKKKIESHRLQ